ncbi:MAG TPA: chorismate mutase [Kiloniellales bacterium]|nr:chorismate mutase [Kiloniellales bacterium]
MPAEKPSLADLRREIDRIDDALHDLLMQRAELTAGIAASKPGGSGTVRPAREAAILRRLVARHKGPFPRAIVARIWREIISANTALQGPFSVAVLANREHDALFQTARAFYGQMTPILHFETPSSVLRAVGDGSATLGLLPLPAIDAKEAWWRLIARHGENVPRVIARVPFAPGEAPSVEGLAVSLGPNEPSGRDRSLLVVETAQELSRSTLRKQMGDAGLTVVEMQSWEGPGQHLTLTEVEGFFAADSPEVANLEADEAIAQVVAIGAYALPLTPAELAGEKAPLSQVEP